MTTTSPQTASGRRAREMLPETRLQAAEQTVRAGQWGEALAKLKEIRVNGPPPEIGRRVAQLSAECHFQIAEESMR